MRKKPSKPSTLQTQLATLNQSIPEDLHLPSLRENRLEGFAALFSMVLPLLNSQGEPVFDNALLQELFLTLDTRFGGCLVPSATAHPPYWGIWHPTGNPTERAERDYVTTIQILANPIEPTNRFFVQLKQILKKAGHVDQQEILIWRVDCWLM